MINTTLGGLLNDLSRFLWKNWVYIEPASGFSPSTPCLVIDTAEADLGSDNFTPLEAEQRSMIEFLSVQDLKDIIENLEYFQIAPPIEVKCAAAAYYFEHDAFMPNAGQSENT